MVQISRAQGVGIVRDLGWRAGTAGAATQSVKLFQRGWNLGARLKPDGIVGPKTSEALLISAARRKAGRSTASAHFSFSEFACHCRGRFASCPRTWVYRDLLVALEKLRVSEGPLHVISGGRCAAYNRTIPAAATYSQHTTGTACDLDLRITWRRLAERHLFAGIGYAGSSGQVDHVDMRHLVGSRSTPAHPMIWRYRW